MTDGPADGGSGSCATVDVRWGAAGHEVLPPSAQSSPGGAVGTAAEHGYPVIPGNVAYASTHDDPRRCKVGEGAEPAIGGDPTTHTRP